MSKNSFTIHAQSPDGAPPEAREPSYSAVDLAVICSAVLIKLGKAGITLQARDIQEASRRRIKLSRTNEDSVHFKISRRTPGQ